ncbi:AAA family ATPase [Halobaculum sp. MBLA0143]|uniref:AAA family ATPase n=1 Tax=Halobaculum sp. MBLA0143 TaxID=3079933 RepID=UPI003526BCB2
MTEHVAFVGTAGGVGTTRTVVETAAALARDGRRVHVLDAAYATQGLSEYVDGRIDPDVTAVCLDEGSLPAASHRLDFGTAGEAVVTPARAPFERVARAKATEPARRLGDLCSEAAASADHVLVDVPPVAANQHVAAVRAADRIVAVATADGGDALRRTVDTLADLDAGVDAVVSTRGELAAADAPHPPAPAPDEPPAALGDDHDAAAVLAATETVLEAELDVQPPEAGPLDRLRNRLRDGEPTLSSS